MDSGLDVRAANRLFSRQASCVNCPDTLPPCNCKANELCTESSRNCNTCASRTCIPMSTPTPTPASSGSGSNAGAIAGGVVGGLAALAILGFLIYWFVIRKRRQMQEVEKTEFTQNAQARRSVASVASTVMTRASNVIQIAYIPGVTNRSPPDTPGTLVPPVPPIPSAYPSTGGSTPAYSEDQHFFMPGDIRDSRYSEMTVDRRSIATSLARSSVATTIYRSNAIVSPMPAQKAFGGKAAVVSVRSGSSSSSEHMSPKMSDAPAVPAITEAQLTRAGMANSSIIARSVVARPVNVKKPSQTKVPTVSEQEVSDSDAVTESSAAASKHSPPRGTDRFNKNESNFDDSSDEEEARGSEPKTNAPRQSKAATETDNSPSTEMGPFSDTQPTVIVSDGLSRAEGAAITSARNSYNRMSGSNHRQRSSAGSNRLRQEAAANSANLAATKGGVTQRSESPFSDSHAVRE